MSNSFPRKSDVLLENSCLILILVFLCRYSTSLELHSSVLKHCSAFGLYRFCYLPLFLILLWLVVSHSEHLSICSTLCSKSTCISGEVERLQRWRKRLQGRLWWQPYDIIVGCEDIQFWSSGLLNSLIAFLWTHSSDANVILEYIVIYNHRALDKFDVNE